MVDQARAARLRQAREQIYENVQEAAEALGVKYPTYAGHENGGRGFNADNAKRYADFFRVEAEWLMFGRGPMKRRDAPPLLALIDKLKPEGRAAVEAMVHALLSNADREEG